METGLCVNSRNRGGANVYREGIFRMNKVLKYATAGLLTLLLFPAMVGTAVAELAAPALLPGFPMLAGPQIMVLWTPVGGATKYKVYINDVLAVETPAATHIVPTPTVGGDYIFTVSAVDAGGKEGKRSSPGKVSIVLLAPPKSVSSNLIGGAPAIRWDEVRGASFYNVYRKDSTSGSFAMIGSTQSNNYRDPDAKKGKTYVYGVTAKNVAGIETDVSKSTVTFAWPAEAVAKKESLFAAKKLKLVGTYDFRNDKGVTAFSAIRKMQAVGGSLFIVDSGRCQVVVGTKTGEFERAFGSNGVLEGQFEASAIYGMGLTREGELAVVDTRLKKVAIFRTTGEFVREFDVESPAPVDNLARGLRPFDVAQDSKGNFFVTDNGGNRVLVFDRSGKFLRQFGKSASQQAVGGGFFSTPTSIAIDKEDNIYIADYLNERVQKFDNSGKFVRFFGADPGAGKLLRPNMLYFDAKGEILYVVDGAYNMVHGYNRSTGAYVFTFTNEKGDHDGNVATWGVDYPNSIAIDGKFLFLVQEKANNVMKFEILE